MVFVLKFVHINTKTIMKKLFQICAPWVVIFTVACSSNSNENASTGAADATVTEEGAGQSAVQDETSDPNVVQVAVGSKDHTTLVAAVKAADLVNALSNAGPFTVFAPVNAAFDKLPAGTVEGLLKPEKLETLADILQYHVFLGVLKAEDLTDGRVLGQVNGGNVTITVKDGATYLNGTAKIIASVPASNGIIHVIDGVLLPGQ